MDEQPKTLQLSPNPDTTFDTSFASYIQSLSASPADYYSVSTQTDIYDDLSAIALDTTLW